MARRMGRDTVKETHWRKHVEAQEASGLAVRAYCQDEGLSESCFHWWRREIARRDREARASRPQKPMRARFAEIRVIDRSGDGTCSVDQDQPLDKSKTDPTEATGVEIYLSGGRRLRVYPDFDERTLLRVVTLLEGARPC
jgi:hypothetical protein